MEENKADGDLAKRCEALYDRIVRDVEEAWTDSWHARFALALEEFVRFVDTREMGNDKPKYIEEMLNTLTPIALYSEKLHRELLVLEHGEDKVNVYDFELPGNVGREIEDRPKDYLSEYIEKAYEDDYPFHQVARFFGADVAEFYKGVVPALRCWQVGSPSAMFEASCHWNIMPGHWNFHLFRAMFTLNTLKHADIGNDQPL